MSSVLPFEILSRIVGGEARDEKGGTVLLLLLVCTFLIVSKIQPQQNTFYTDDFTHETFLSRFNKLKFF